MQHSILFRRSLAAAASLGLALTASAAVLNFDLQKPGPLEKITGVDFPLGAEVVIPGALDPQPHSPYQYLRCPGNTLTISFANPVGYVRVRVGNTIASTKYVAVMRAYGAGNLLVGTMELTLDSSQRDVIYPLQVTRALGRDIRSVQITCGNAAQAIIDTLEIGQITAGTINWYNWDTNAPGQIVSYVPGATFMTLLPEIVRASTIYGGSFSAPNVLQAPRSLTNELFDPEPMIIQFSPPQQYVQFKVGKTIAETNGFRAVLKAYDSAARTNLLASAVLDMNQRLGINEQIECACIEGANIAAVELRYIDRLYGYREVIDDFLFGPRDPLRPADATPPQITITAPLNNVLVRQSGPSPETGITVAGTIVEDSPFESAYLYVQDEAGTVIRTYVTPRLRSGQTREYDFTAQAWLHQGPNRIWMVATDAALNLATNVGGAITVLFGMPPASVDGMTPATVQTRWVFRAAGQGYSALETPDAQTVTVRGTNLHEYIGIVLDSAGQVFRPSLTRASESQFSFSVPWEVFTSGSPNLRVRVMDYYRNPSGRTLADQTLNVIPDPGYPQLYGFGFDNPSHAAERGEYFSAFYDTYNCNLYCGETWWSATAGYEIYSYIMDQMASAGSCVGMSATSLLMARGNYDIRHWDPTPGQLIKYPAGFLQRDLLPPAYTPPRRQPLNLFANIRTMHAKQLSVEFARRLMEQVMIGDSIDNSGGNPAARLAEIRANPTNYVLCMEQRIGEGHAVVPYKVVGNRIYVYDSNYPYNHSQPRTTAQNQRALNSYVDVDTVHNTYSFPNLNYSGTWMFTFPINLWYPTTRLHPVDNLDRILALLVCGSVRPEYSTEDGLNRYGWSASGEFTNAFAGAIPMPILGGSAADAGASWPLLVDNRHARIQANFHHQGGGYSVLLCQSNRTFGVRTLQGRAGDSDTFRVTREQTNLTEFSFGPAQDGLPFIATIGTGADWQVNIARLNVPSNELVGFSLALDGQNWRIRNTTSRAQTPALLVREGTLSTPALPSLFTLPTLPAGGTITLVRQADRTQLVAQIDTNSDNVIDATQTLTGQSARTEDNPAAQDLNNNGIADPVDILFGSATDGNSNGIPDDAEAPGTITTATDGNWAAKTLSMVNTSEAQLMVRVGDIDNLGFGWPENFNPFAGTSTPLHAYPWQPDPTDPQGTDLIMVPSSYDGTSPYFDGYTEWTIRPDNLPRTIQLDYASRLPGLTVTNAMLQLFVDDFQAPIWGTSYQVYLNSRRATFLEDVLNNLIQTGPVGKLITVRIPAEFLPEIATGSLALSIDDPTTGSGDGFAIDFVKLLVNHAGALYTGIVNGYVRDSATSQPLTGVRLTVGNVAEVTNQFDGFFYFAQIPAGLVTITASKFGYQSKTISLDVLHNTSTTAPDLLLEAIPTADVSIAMTTTNAGDIGTRYTFTIVASNTGPDTATNVLVNVTLPSTAAFAEAHPPADGFVGWDVFGRLTFRLPSVASGDSRTCVFGLDAARRGLLDVRAEANASQPDPDLSNNSAAVQSVIAGAFGGLFLSGHDADAHAGLGQAGNQAGAARLLAGAVNYVTFGKLSPRILLVTGVEDPGAGFADPRLGMTAAGFGFEVADFGSGSSNTLDLHAVAFTNYDAVVVASTCGGWLRQAEVDALNSRAADLLDFLNQGGGLVAFSQADQPDGHPITNAFGFLPAAGFATAYQEEQGFVLTDFGFSLGIADSDINGNSAHGYFAFTAGLTAVDQDATGRTVSLAMRGQPISASGAGSKFANLGLAMEFASGAFQPGDQVRCWLTITNHGLMPATQVMITDVLPTGAEWVGAAAEDRPFSAGIQDGQLLVILEQLATNASARIWLDLRPSQAGLMLNKATVCALESDPDIRNNAATAQVDIQASNTAPTVAITSPTALQSFSSPAAILLCAQAAADGGLAGVNFYINDIFLGGVNMAPWEVLWDQVPEGTYTLTAVATDQQGATAKSAPLTFTVTPMGQDLKITALGLANGQLTIEWNGGTADLQSCTNLAAPDWQSLGTVTVSPTNVPINRPQQFFRLWRPPAAQ